MKSADDAPNQKRVDEALSRVADSDGELSGHLPSSFLKFLQILAKAREVKKEKTT